MQRAQVLLALLVVLGDDPVGLERNRGERRKPELPADHPVGGGEVSVDVAVGVLALPRDVARILVVDEGSRGLERVERIDDGGQGLVVDLDEGGGILGEIAVLRATTTATGSPTNRTLSTAIGRYGGSALRDARKRVEEAEKVG